MNNVINDMKVEK